jgi:hypothetical protein
VNESRLPLLKEIIDGGEYSVDWNEYDDDDEPDIYCSLVGWPGCSCVIQPPGTVVRMVDADGLRCLGVVEKFSNGLLYIRALWETMSGVSEVHLVGSR